MLRSIAAAIAVLSAAAFAAAQPANPEGVLLLAHGGGPEWNQRVNALAAALDFAAAPSKSLSGWPRVRPCSRPSTSSSPAE